ncbi:MAG TPA: hypothetical protein PK542_11780, partial [Treponemataceae bacterium]|nr:hypothetical protein [Treponemataceae bacterium]
ARMSRSRGEKRSRSTAAGGGFPFANFRAARSRDALGVRRRSAWVFAAIGRRYSGVSGAPELAVQAL